MENNKKEAIVISLGGSLVVPDKIDVGFIKNLKHCLVKYFGQKKFIIFVGGGKVCRHYQKALQDFGATDYDKDLMGINISRLNAGFVKQAFKEFAYEEIILDPNLEIKTNKEIVMGAGWKPGWSTDYVAVLSAKINKISLVINLTNIDYVYDKDPAKFPQAKPIEKISWKDFKKIVGNKWAPGMSSPFDPIASKLAEQSKIKVVIMNGKHLSRLEDFLNNKPFIGTTIQ